MKSEHPFCPPSNMLNSYRTNENRARTPAWYMYEQITSVTCSRKEILIGCCLLLAPDSERFKHLAMDPEALVSDLLRTFA